MTKLPPGLEDALSVPLIDAILGRRSRRFALGCDLPDGALAYKSKHPPMPLSELEEMLLITSMAGNTGWSFLINRHPRNAPNLVTYGAAASGRAFPSAAGIQTSELFWTNDTGTYFMETRDAPALVKSAVDSNDIEALLEAHRARVRKVSDGRLEIARYEPHMEEHNFWCANIPGSTLIMPIGDLAQHMIAMLCFMAENGGCIYDDINKERIPGIEKFKDLVDVDNPQPLTYVEQYSLSELVVELGSAVTLGAVVLGAMGLGGWPFDGLERNSVFGASGDPKCPGLGFQFQTDPRWSVPNATGLPGVFEAFCPPNFPDMAAAVEAHIARKFGPGGPFHPDTPGPWRDSRKVRGSAKPHSPEFHALITLQCQYIYDRFGKFPGTVPSLCMPMYLQAHHLDLEYYDHHFDPGSYLSTHAHHMEKWHPKK